MSMLSFLLTNKMADHFMNKEKVTKKKKFKARYIALLGFALCLVIPTVLGTPFWLSLLFAGVFGTTVGAVVGTVMKVCFALGSSISKIFNHMKKKKNTEKEPETEEVKTNKLSKVKDKEKTSLLWQRIKTGFHNGVERAKQKRKERQMETEKEEEKQEENEYEKEETKENIFVKAKNKWQSIKSGFHNGIERINQKRKAKQEALEEVDKIFDFSNGTDISAEKSGADEESNFVDAAEADGFEDFVLTSSVTPQEVNPLFTYRLKKNELRKPRYVVFDESYESPSLETSADGHFSFNRKQFMRNAQQQFENLNHQLVQTQDEIKEIEQQLAEFYGKSEKKLTR